MTDPGWDEGTINPTNFREGCGFLGIYPGIPKTIHSNGFSEKIIILVVIYNQQFQGTIVLMVYDFKGMRVPSRKVTAILPLKMDS